MMTQINLLPTEWRKKEMTPLATLVPVLCGFTVIVATAFFWGWLHFAQLARAEQERDEVSSIYSTLKGQLAYAGRLKGEEGEYQNREKTLAGIRASRVPWTKKLDQWWDVVVDDDGGKKYLLKFDSLRVAASQSRGNRGEIPGDEFIVSGICFNQEAPLKHFNHFHEALKQSPFFREDFAEINDPAGKTIEDDSEFLPNLGWTVDLTSKMKPRELGKPGRGKPNSGAQAGK